MGENNNWNVDRIVLESPDIPGYGGGQWAMYSVGCCWWTSFPDDLGSSASGLPGCPYCGSVLMQVPLVDFITQARMKPEHYGEYGLDTFAAAHSKNANGCSSRWEAYIPIDST